jgi:hypothetical protein
VKTRTIRLLIAAALAAPLTLGWVNVARQPSDGPTILSSSVLPFYLFGVVFTGNAHAPLGLAVYVSMYLVVFMLVYAVLAIWTKIRSRVVDSDA